MGYNAKPNRPNKYKTGFYSLINENKYISDPTKIVYRSSLEQRFCIFADKSPKIIKWGSETIGIPYSMWDYDKKTVTKHTYYVDFYLLVENKNSPTGQEEWLIEVKPEAEYLAIINNIPPAKPEKITAKSLETWEYNLKMFHRNKHKWAAAQEYAKNKHMIFYVVTEKVIPQLFK